MIKGAEGLIHEPHAVRREMLPSFQTIVAWYKKPASLAIVVRSEPTLCWPPLFLSRGILRQSLPLLVSQRKHRAIHFFENAQYSS
jgi:hypothetical protein